MNENKHTEMVNQQTLAALKACLSEFEQHGITEESCGDYDVNGGPTKEVLQKARRAIAAAEAAQPVGEAVAWVSPECLEWLKDRAKHLDCPIQFHGRTLPLGNYSIALYAKPPGSAQPVALPDDWKSDLWRYGFKHQDFGFMENGPYVLLEQVEMMLSAAQKGGDV